MSNKEPVLEGKIVQRALHFFWIVDYSGSMEGDKIATLNTAISESIPEIKKALASHPEVNFFLRAIKFADSADWHVGPTPVPLESFVWPDLETDGATATAQAINMLCDELEIEKMRKRGLPPICILLSDGFCTDKEEEYDQAIKRINEMPWGRKAIRLVIAIGSDKNEYDEASLLKFVNQENVGLLHANTPGKLINYIKWASVTASISSSRSRGADNASSIMVGPPDIDDNDEDDVF